MSDALNLASPTGAPESARPLCVDLDGTLLSTDSLEESAVAAMANAPLTLLRLPLWLAAGKAVLKRELATRWRFDPATLPYSPAVIEHLKAERAAGRRLVLCTAADRRIAEAIAAHLGIFDEVIASDGERNLRGPAKAAALVARFGPQGFDYMGNDATDHPVWAAAATALVANAAPSVQRDAAARHRVGAILGDPPRREGRALLRAIRPHQWVKNLLCLVPPVAAGDWWGAASWGGAIGIMLAFCAVASAIYLLNDLSDLAADRAHPRKRLRPFASGALSIRTGLAGALGLLLAGTALAAALGALLPVLAYLALSLAYNAGLKEQPLVDVFILAALYTIRLFAGGEASSHPVSLWLLGFAAFLFLSLAFVKRLSELQRFAGTGAEPWQRLRRRGYQVSDVALLKVFGVASSFASALVLALYVQSEAVAAQYANPAVLWAAVPLLLFWQCRLWLSTARGYMHDDPIVYAARDRVSWAVLACLGLAVVAASLPLPGWIGGRP